MSVRKGDRSQGKLEVLDKARFLKEYSLNLIKNSKVFPKSTRWLYASPIATEVRNASVQIRKANSLPFPEFFKERRGCQMLAHASLNSMYDLIEDAMLAGYISSDRAGYWTSLVKDTDEKLKAWSNSDKARFEKS